MGARDSEEEAMYIMVGQIIYIYMLTPLPPRTNLSVFQNSKIPKKIQSIFLEIPKF